MVTQRPPKHEPHCYQADGQCHCHHIPSLKHEDKPRFEEAKQILVPNGEVTKNLHHLYSPPPKGGVNSGSRGAPTVHPSVGELKKHSQGALLEAKSVPGAEVPSLKGRCPPPPPWGQVLDLSSATPTQCDIFTAHAGSAKAWMGVRGEAGHLSSNGL